MTSLLMVAESEKEAAGVAEEGMAAAWGGDCGGRHRQRRPGGMCQGLVTAMIQ